MGEWVGPIETARPHSHRGCFPLCDRGSPEGGCLCHRPVYLAYTSWFFVKQGNGLRVSFSISPRALQDSDRHVFSSGTHVGEVSPRMSVAPVR